MSDRPGSPLGEALRAALAKHPRVRAWQLRSVERRSRQSYLIETRLESERVTTGETHEAVVFVANGELVGRAAVTITPAEADQVASRVDEAVYMAGLGGDAPWALPGSAESPRVELHDPALDGDRALATSRRIVEEWRAAVSGIAGVQPSSMELFCETDVTRLENSAGLVTRFSATQVSLLTIVLASEGARATESVSWERRRRAADLDVAGIVRQAAEEARDLLRAEPPPSGSYPVVIDAREIDALFSPLRANASAESLYRKVSRFEVGKPIPIEGSGGEPLVMLSNAIAPYGLSSYVADAEGVPGRRVALIENGVFARPWATKQYADYLATEATGAFANLEVPPGKTPLADLLTDDGPVLHVRQFSWLTPDQARGNFGSEVRVGYLHEKGRRRPVKGGSVSGGLFAALGGARFASESVFLGDYLGTAGVRLEGLTTSAA